MGSRMELSGGMDLSAIYLMEVNHSQVLQTCFCSEMSGGSDYYTAQVLASCLGHTRLRGTLFVSRIRQSALRWSHGSFRL